MLPIAIGVTTSIGTLISQRSAGDVTTRTRLRFGSALMLVITYSITVGGLLLPIGSPPNLIGRDLVEKATNEPITFLEWFLMAFPIVVVMFIAVIVVVLALNKPEVKYVPGVEEFVAAEKRRLGPMTRGERNTLIAFGLAVVGWTLPGVVALFTGDDSTIYADISSYLDEGVVAILAACLLFVLPISWPERRFTLNWNEAARIDWGTILLFGSGIVLGNLMSKTGLAKKIGEGLSDALERIERDHHHHPRRGHRRDHLGDDQQHGQCRHRRADRHLPGPGGQREPGGTRAGGRVRRQLRVHAAGVDPAQRHRLQLRLPPDHPHDQSRGGVRRDRGGALRRSVSPSWPGWWG